MLRLSKLGYGRADYYLLPTGVLGNTQTESLGSWTGRGIVVLGLEGTVIPEAWRSVLSGRDPVYDRELSPSQRRVKVAGFDLTFCAPKSVSLLATLGEKEIAARVVSGHVRAASEAFSYLEEHGLAVRRKAGSGRTVSGYSVLDEFSRGNAGRAILPVGGALGASFLHRTSRSLDPHLHTHTVVANLGFSGANSGIGSDIGSGVEIDRTMSVGSDTGSGSASSPGDFILPAARGGSCSIQASSLDWSALDGRGLYAHRAAADALYHAVLRYELVNSLGVEWNMPVRGRADIKGIPRDVIDQFSRRQAQITEHLDSVGLGADASSRARYIAGVVTRSEKDLSISADDLVAEWRERAVHWGLGPRQLEGVLGRSSERFVEEGEIARRMVSAGERTLDALMERGAPACRRELVRAWSSALVSGAPAEQIGKAVDSVLDVARGQYPRIGKWLSESEMPMNRSAIEHLEIGAGPSRVPGEVMGARTKIAARESEWPDGTRTSRRVGVSEERYELSMIKSAMACRKDLLVEQSATSSGRYFKTQGLGQGLEGGTGVVAERLTHSLGSADRWMQRIGPRPVNPVELAVWMSARLNILSYCEQWSPGGSTHAGRDIDSSGDSQGDARIDHLPGTAKDVESNPAHIHDERSSSRSSLARLAETSDLERMIRQTRLRLHMGPEQSRDQGKGMELGY